MRARYVRCNANDSGGDHFDNLWGDVRQCSNEHGREVSYRVGGRVNFSLSLHFLRALLLLQLCYEVNTSATMCHAGNTRCSTGSLILTFLLAITNAASLRAICPPSDVCSRCAKLITLNTFTLKSRCAIIHQRCDLITRLD